MWFFKGKYSGINNLFVSIRNFQCRIYIMTFDIVTYRKFMRPFVSHLNEMSPIISFIKKHVIATCINVKKY